jgi:S1-C subfamily serine protease
MCNPNPFRISAAWLAVAVSCLSAAAPADELAEKGRAILAKNQHAVVTVQIVLKSKFSVSGAGGQSSESRQDVTGTVVDPSGLTVLSLSATDPAQLIQSMMGGMSEEDMKFKMETELSDVKILLDDGTEIAAEVVLRDKDLDLAFIRPKTKLAKPSEALDLSQAGKAELLDQVVTINRLGSAAGRAYAASVERISAVVQRPRLFYIPGSGATATALGSPAFTLDGKPLGIFVMRSLKGKGGGGMFGMFSGQQDNVTTIIVTADAVAKAAKQVPPAGEGKEPEKKQPEK